MRLETICKLAKLSTLLGGKAETKVEWTPDSLRNYIEVIRAARSLVSGGLIALGILQLSTLLLVGFWHGLSVIQPWSLETWAWMEVCVCGGLLVGLAISIAYFLSQKFWIRTFKVDQAVKSLNDNSTSL